MAESSEPRALSAALSGPAFVTRSGGAITRAASRHIERWAPEASAARQGSFRNLGFVDRLVSPWLETAQRSASLRMFSQLRQGVGEREGMPVSWVFPRPWYQDELDWMAAARKSGSAPRGAAPQMLTTRGTYVSPAAAARQAIVPETMHEFVAPSLSLARPHVADSVTSERVYSPLVPFAAAQAAHVMSHAVAPLMGDGGAARMSPGLRSVLTAMLERAARSQVADAAPVPTRIASAAPEMVTPPHPRPDSEPSILEARAHQVIADMSAQRARVAELQRVTRATAEHEYQVRAQADAAASAARTVAAAPAAETPIARVDASAEQKRIEQRVAERLAERERSQSSQQVAQAERQRAQIEEKIATAQRAQSQATSARLHEQSRNAALADARAATVQAQQAQAQAQAAVAATAAARIESRREETATESRMPAAIAAALAALPPELAGYIGRRPDRAVQAISEVSEALRAVELIAHGAAHGRGFEPARGPRLAMPAGLGGLVATVERSSAPTPLARAMAPATQVQMPATAGAQAARRASSSLRVPAMSWLQAPGATHASAGVPSAISQAAASTPAAIQHVAWADRWLARFAGARPRSLDAMTIASAPAELRLAALAAAAPDVAYVSPMLEQPDSVTTRAMARGMRPMPSSSRDATGARELSAVAANAPAMTQAAPADVPVQRFADDAETPDEVFAAISAAATRSRPTARAAQIAGITLPPAIDSVNASASVPRETFADFVASAPPSAPGAGLSAQLASSPFAPALHHLLALPAMPSFDVRALMGSGLAASYLAGLIAPDTHELSVAPEMPAWAAWGDARVQAAQASLSGMPGMSGSGESFRPISDFDGSLVAPTPEGFIVERGASAEQAHESPTHAAAPSYDAASASAAIAPLTTLRSALLSWEVEQRSFGGGAIETRVESPSISAHNVPVSQSLIDAMRLPMLGDTFSPAALTMGGPNVAEAAEAAGVALTAPGMIADRAQSWSVAQERSSSDLAFDFVPPELVLAARVYGLGPAEAAQAARLAIAGPGQLAAMASAVDRTFVAALEAQRERTSGGPRAAGLGPRASGENRNLRATAPDMPTLAPHDTTEAFTGGPRPEARGPAAPSTIGASFGVEKRVPRGAFLWPSATVGALGLHAPTPDGDQAMSVAALELLAAQSVAELGTYASIHGDKLDPAVAEALGTDSSTGFATGTGTMPRIGAGTGTMPRVGASATAASEDDVVASAAAMVPTSRRSKFDALYLALGQSASGREWSPAARAARALALAGRGEDQMTPRERASIAWDVLPAVYAAPDDGGAVRDERNYVGGEYVAPGSSVSTGVASARAAQRRAELRDAGFVDMRPGLAPLSGRTGEALGSYVTSQPMGAGATSSSGSTSTRENYGALARVPTAAPELVRTGRPSGRHGGGEVEIPAWFEQAARKMFSERGGASGLANDISLAELTLVQSAPSASIAASSRTLPSAMPQPPASQNDERPHDHKEEHRIDHEKVANDVYRHVQSLMDSARARNGEPYL